MPSASVVITAHRVLEELHAARIARLFLHAIEAAEGEVRPAHGLVARNAPTFVLGGLALEMKSKLVIELALHLRAPEDRAQAIAEIAREIGNDVCRAHRISRTRRTATVSRRHASVSASSWLRPVRVSS